MITHFCVDEVSYVVISPRRVHRPTQSRMKMKITDKESRICAVAAEKVEEM